MLTGHAESRLHFINIRRETNTVYVLNALIKLDIFVSPFFGGVGRAEFCFVLLPPFVTLLRTSTETGRARN